MPQRQSANSAVLPAQPQSQQKHSNKERHRNMQQPLPTQTHTVPLLGDSLQIFKIRISEWNVNGALQRLGEIQHLFRTTKLDILGITETRTSTLLSPPHFRLPVTVHCIPATTTSIQGPPRGGIALLIDENIPSYVSHICTSDASDATNFFQILQVQLRNGIDIILVYLSPRLSLPTFESTMTRVLEISGPNTIIMGDFNAHHSNWTHKTNTRGRSLLKAAQSKNLNILEPQKPTFYSRVHNTSSTIDLFITTHRVPVRLPTGVWTGASDHEPIVTQTPATCVKQNQLRRITKTMLANPANQKSAERYYQTHFHTIISQLRRAQTAHEAQQLFTESQRCHPLSLG